MPAQPEREKRNGRSCGPQFAQPLVAGPGHRQAVDVVRLPVVAARAPPARAVPSAAASGPRTARTHSARSCRARRRRSPAPAAPRTARPTTCAPAGRVKSGIDRLARRHTTPRTCRPCASRTNASTAAPLSYTALPGSAFTAGSTIDTSRTPSAAQVLGQPRQIGEARAVDGEDPVRRRSGRCPDGARDSGSSRSR